MLLEISFIIISVLLFMIMLYFIKYSWFCAIICSIANTIDPQPNGPAFDDLPSLPNLSKNKDQILYRPAQKPRISITPQNRQQVKHSNLRTRVQYTNGPRPLNPASNQSSSCSDYSDNESIHPTRKRSYCNIC